MKKRLFILVPVFALLICAITPFTALAYTTPTADIMYRIANAENWDSSKAVALQTNDGEYWLLRLSGATYSYDSSANKLHGQIDYSLGTVEIMKFDSRNPYTTHSTHSWKLNNSGKGDSITNCTVLGSKVTIYEFDSATGAANKEKVFLKVGATVTPTPAEPGAPTTSHSKVFSSIDSLKLQNILSELVATLPISLPVFVTFLAIRKAIAFTLATLRSA